MGKVRTRILGFDDLEKEQKEASKKRAEDKKMLKQKGGPDKDSDVAVDVASDEKAQVKKSPKKKEEDARVTKKRSVKYQKSAKLRDANIEYSLEDAIKALKTMAYAGFTESVEVHINLKNGGLRGELEFPFSTGKTVNVAIVSDELLEKLENGIIDFDVLVTHPSYMPRLAKFARLLGPKGLMPSPKIGTISDKPEEVAKKFSGGLVRWRSEAKFPVLHQAVAKVNQADEEIVQNVAALLKAIGKNNIETVYLSSTMSPSVKLSTTVLV